MYSYKIYRIVYRIAYSYNYLNVCRNKRGFYMLFGTFLRAKDE